MFVTHETRGRAVDRTLQDHRRSLLGRHGLQPGIDGDQAGGVGTHHAGIDLQRLFEGGLIEPTKIADVVVMIHEHVGADLQLGEHAELGVDEMRAGA